MDLASQYNNDEEMRQWVRRLHSVAFVKPTDVIDAFESIEDELPDSLDAYADYFRRTWIGKKTVTQQKHHYLISTAGMSTTPLLKRITGQIIK